MKTRLFVTFALLLLALTVIPASGALAAAPAAQPAHAQAFEQEVAFNGYVQSLPKTVGWIGAWKVSGKTVHVSKSTLIDQTDFRVRRGAYVRIEGFKLADGTYKATSIDILG